MAFQQILALAGPLPVEAPFDSPVIGPVDFIITGTAWTSVAAGPIGVVVLVDGIPIGKTAMYANFKSDHMTLPTVFGSITLDSLGPHTVSVIPANPNTTTDYNDHFTVTIQY